MFVTLHVKQTYEFYSSSNKTWKNVETFVLN